MYQITFNFRSSGALIAAAACWGLATVITKSVLTAIPPITLLVFQLTTSLVLLWSIVLLSRRPWPSKTTTLRVGAFGLLNPGLSYTLSLIGLTTTTASMSTLLWASEPVLIIGLAWTLLREKLSTRIIVFSIAALMGVVSINGFDLSEIINGQATGNFLILGGVLCCAVYTVGVQRVGVSSDPIVAVTVQQMFALTWALLIWPLELNVINFSALFSIDGLPWFWAAVSGIVYYALAFWFYLQGLSRTSASQAGIFINFIPIFGLSGAYIFLNERLSLLQWIGAGIVLLSVSAILIWQDRGDKRKAIVT